MPYINTDEKYQGYNKVCMVQDTITNKVPPCLSHVSMEAQEKPELIIGLI